MNLSDFDFELPDHFIAQTAAEPRDSSRLMLVHRTTGQIEHRIFYNLPEYLRAGDALVVNQTRVRPARLAARKVPGGGTAEILLLNRISPTVWEAMLGGARIRVGSVLEVERDRITVRATVRELREGAVRLIEFDTPMDDLLDRLGELPLPPYINQKLTDPERYQTVYARKTGAAAAPTAGLHFTPELLMKIREMGVEIVSCTLHVGLGTFLPVRAEQIEQHKLHEEYAELLPEDARRLNEIKLAGGRIIAVGTTSVRTLESAALKSAGEAGVDVCAWRPVVAMAEPTSIFIMPGYTFRAVDGMVTNFHLPKSTLMMLVSAFSGRELILHAYEEAKREGYRFYSLGDATLLID